MAGLSLTIRRFDKIQIGDVVITFTKFKSRSQITLAIEAPQDQKIEYIKCTDPIDLDIRKRESLYLENQ